MKTGHEDMEKKNEFNGWCLRIPGTEALKQPGGTGGHIIQTQYRASERVVRSVRARKQERRANDSVNGSQDTLIEEIRQVARKVKGMWCVVFIRTKSE